MSTAASTESGYTTDVVFPSMFGAFQAPIHLAYAASLGRYAAPAVDGKPFTYCDLGSGVGLTLCILADCYPEAEFHGIDVNPEHIRISRDLAARAGLRNVTFHEADFSDVDRLVLPTLDFVTLGGIYSWLTAPLRAACVAFAVTRLSERGLLYLHYAALPGNNQIDALYTLLREIAATVQGDSLMRFKEACRVAREMRAAKSRFFQLNPIAAARVDQMGTLDPRVMAHEVLNAQRSALSVRDVANEVGSDLVFAANAQLELNDPTLVAPLPLRPMLSQMHGVSREMLLDTINNTTSRMDVWARTEVPREEAVPAFWIDRLTQGPLKAERRQLSERARTDLMAPVYDAILALVNGSAIALPELATAHALTPYPDAPEAIRRLIAVKLLNVLRRPYASTVASASKLTSRLNEIILHERIEAAGVLPFASPVAGTQVVLPVEDRLALMAMLGGDFEDAWRRIKATKQAVRYEGRVVESARILHESAGARLAQHGGRIVSGLQRLGVLS